MIEQFIRLNNDIVERQEESEVAIPLIEQALQLATKLTSCGTLLDPAVLAPIQRKLGFLYHNRIVGDRRENIERAITATKAAADPRNRMADPDGWGRAQFNLGNFYADRLEGRRAENIELAIAAFRSATEVLTPASAPQIWAQAQHALGQLFNQRLTDDRQANLEEAIASYDREMTIRTRRDLPVEWARAMSERAMVYANRLRGDHADNQEQAIAALEDALSVLSESDTPLLWAAVTDNLSKILRERISGDRTENLERAIVGTERALRIFTIKETPVDWSASQVNLGAAYCDRVRGDKADNIDRCIQAFEAALQVIDKELSPAPWGRLHVNLSAAYELRIRGNRTANLRKSISLAEEAAALFASHEDWSHWAGAQNNLGGAYSTLASVSRGTVARRDALDRAVAAYALSVGGYERIGDLRFQLIALRNLALAHRDRGEWGAVLSTADKALSVIDIIGATASRTGIENIDELAPGLGRLAAYAAWRSQSPAAAWDRLEKGRARLLRYTLGLEGLGLRPEQRSELADLRAEVARAEALAQNLQGAEKGELLAQIASKRRQAIDLVSSANPAAAMTIQAQLGRALDHVQVVVAPVSSGTGGVILVGHRSASGPVITAVRADGLKDEALVHAYIGVSGETKSSWLGSYLLASGPEASDETRTAWRKNISATDRRLGAILGSPLFAALDKAGARRGDRVALLLPGLVSVFPVQLLRDKAGRALIETYELVQTPSLATFVRATPPASVASAAILSDPSGDLRYAAIEGMAVGSWFRGAARAIPEVRDVDELAAILRGATHWHFATHGKFDWERPSRSGVLLPGGSQLTVAMLAEAQFGRPRLVFLSACETGLAFDSRKPDTFIGLPTAFLEAGAEIVIGSLWEVDDASTALLTIRFYELHIGERLSASSAMRQAQLWLMSATADDLRNYLSRSVASGHVPEDQAARLWLALARAAADETPFSHPFYWAAFVVVGI